ncbi:MAG: dephospho-CoA kinase [Roseateles depolymerans]|uniref:Dephospho-CoA kinase n=1 Tax=Roseateles depolymerans TaxID=76731 RepID=A0A2W5DYK5_9BURK|nr:MAG: dephospho-CoA kinase [Roseateles depolymerans]
MPLRIGLTGGIGSGKSTVAGMLRDAGATIIDADAQAHALTRAGGAAMPAIEAAFGPQLLTPDGALDRDRMRALAFTDTRAKRRLEDILHPLIGQAMRAEATSAQAAGTPLIVLDIPLLVESGHWRAQLDRVLVVDCTVETQTERVLRRPGWPLERVTAVLAAQATREARLAAADAVLFNDDIGLDALRSQVFHLASRWGCETIKRVAALGD